MKRTMGGRGQGGKGEGRGGERGKGEGEREGEEEERGGECKVKEREEGQIFSHNQFYTHQMLNLH